MAPKTARTLIALRLLAWISIFHLKNSSPCSQLFSARSGPIGNQSIRVRLKHLSDVLTCSQESLEKIVLPNWKILLIPGLIRPLAQIRDDDPQYSSRGETNQLKAPYFPSKEGEIGLNSCLLMPQQSDYELRIELAG
jgi:hypothetical protein